MQTSLMQYLKESTRPNHDDAESQPFQSALVNGTLDFDVYCDYLQQLRAIHAPIERKLAENLTTNAQIGAVVKSEYYQLPFLENDLKALNLPLSGVNILPSVQQFAQSPIFDSQPESCLGVLYVLLGSKHGAKFIAHKVKEAYSLKDGGCSYFNPYGENFRALWQEFVASMNAMSTTDSSRQAILTGATLTFDIFGAVGVDLWQAAAKVGA